MGPDRSPAPGAVGLIGTVCVCLPHYLQFPVTREAIRAGKQVLVEKPLTTSPEEGQQLVDAAAEAGVASAYPTTRSSTPRTSRPSGSSRAGPSDGRCSSGCAWAWDHCPAAGGTPPTWPVAASWPTHGALPRNPDALRVLARHNRVEPLDSLDPEPCAGVYAEVLRPGRIRTGDPVRLA